ncbi:MAG: NRDE family protein [Leadbetterella sp.]
MCVLTAIKAPDNQIYLTSNRDEKVAREKATLPKKILVGNTIMYAPIDPVSKGTWIATSKDFSAVLLNGGFQNHVSKPPYRHSRGQIIPDFLKMGCFVSFSKNYNFEGIEPFTLVVFDHKSPELIRELRWCSDTLHTSEIVFDRAQIWSSSTLYSPEAILKRKEWFNKMLEINQANLNQSHILEFHKQGGASDKNDSIFLRRSEDLRTLSTTQIVLSHDGHTLYYEDYIQNTQASFRIL